MYERIALFDRSEWLENEEYRQLWYTLRTWENILDLQTSPDSPDMSNLAYN